MEYLFFADSPPPPMIVRRQRQRQYSKADDANNTVNGKACDKASGMASADSYFAWSGAALAALAVLAVSAASVMAPGW
jgi:hypothetical protein